MASNVSIPKRLSTSSAAILRKLDSGQRRLRGTVGAAQDLLVEINDRPCHQTRFIGTKIGAGPCYFVRFDQTAEGESGFGLRKPAVRHSMIHLSDAVLARRISPADAEAVHANAIPHQAEGDVLG